MDKIFTANDRAKELHLKNNRELIAYLCAKSGERWNGRVNDSDEYAVTAFVDWGRWSWRCECGSQMYAEPSDPIGFCDTCGNAFVPNGDARKVLFPNNIKEIEAALVERELGGSLILQEKMGRKFGASQLAMMPQFAGTLSRNWQPGESPETLREEYRKKKDKGV